MQETLVEVISVNYDLPPNFLRAICFSKPIENPRLPMSINCDCKTSENILFRTELANRADHTRAIFDWTSVPTSQT